MAGGGFMTEKLLLIILLTHFVADFILQTHKQAINKSSNIWYLLAHTGVYSAVWSLVSMFILPIPIAIIFTLITFGAHTATDYVTSRIVKRLFSRQDYHNGFVVIGIDQMLHYVQLYLTFKYLL